MKQKRERERSKKPARFKRRMSSSHPCHATTRQPQWQVPAPGRGCRGGTSPLTSWGTGPALSPLTHPLAEPIRHRAELPLSSEQLLFWRAGSQRAMELPAEAQPATDKSTNTKGNAAGVFRALSLALTTGFTARREPVVWRCTNTLCKQRERGVNSGLWLAAARFQLPATTQLCSWRARRCMAPVPSATAQAACKRTAARGTQCQASPPCPAEMECPGRWGPPLLRRLWAGALPQPRSTNGSCCSGSQVSWQQQPPEPGIFLAGLRKMCTKTNMELVKSDIQVGDPTPQSWGRSSQHVARMCAEQSTGSTAAKPTLSRPCGSCQLLGCNPHCKN